MRGIVNFSLRVTTTLILDMAAGLDAKVRVEKDVVQVFNSVRRSIRSGTGVESVGLELIRSCI